MSENWIGIDEAAEYLGIKVVTLRTWIRKNNGVPAHKVGKFRKCQKSELDEWIISGKSAEIDKQ